MEVGYRDATSTNISIQNVRAGLPTPFIVTLQNSNAAVAVLRSDEPVTVGQTVTKPILPGIYYTQAGPGATTSWGFGFDPIGVGSTTVTVSGPVGVASVSNGGSVTVGVTAPGITGSASARVGAGLQLGQSATLGGSNHGGVTATVTSSAPGVVRVSPDATTAGTASIGVNVPNGSTNVSFHVQGMENVTGTATITVTAPGFSSHQYVVTVATTGVRIAALESPIAATAPEDSNLWVEVGIANGTFTDLETTQNVRAGSPGFVITLSNSNAAVAQLRSDQPALTGQVVTKPIQPNIYYTVASGAGTSYGLAFDPLAAGTTTVTASGPAGVVTMSTTGARLITVSP